MQLKCHEQKIAISSDFFVRFKKEVSDVYVLATLELTVIRVIVPYCHENILLNKLFQLFLTD